jgi:Ca2+-binding EF-hand superfamily protein
LISKENDGLLALLRKAYHKGRQVKTLSSRTKTFKRKEIEMSKKKTLLIAGSLVGGTVLLVGALGGAHAFGGRHMGCSPDGGSHFGGPGMVGGPAVMRRLGAMIRQADVNKDGVITKEEATAHRQKRFDRFDLDKNGEVTKDEAVQALIKRFEGRIKRRLRSFDENGDGKVTKEEFNAPILERFAFRDANGDGKLTKDELPRFLDLMGGQRGGWFQGPRGSHGGPGRGNWRWRPDMQGPGNSKKAQ